MTVVHVMLGNAAIAALLAVLALALGHVCRSPVVRHAAWVLVLLKLVTPALVPVPLTVLPASWGAGSGDPTGDHVVRFAPEPAPESRPFPPAVWERYQRLGAAEWALGVWVGGAAVWFAWQGRRIVRFRRRVAAAEDGSPELQAAARRLAAALGIAQPPGVKVATGIGSPMLWGWGRGAVVLVPRDLLDRLSAAARDTILAHELAHFLRRDHWVRVLEFVATGLYWWHPAVWFARRGIEAAEEECCDAWVVGGLAASPRLYAGALLATVDFEAELLRPRLPPGACAASRSARLLRHRLAGMMHAGPPRRLHGWVVVGAVAALLARPVLRAAPPETPAPTDVPVAAPCEAVRSELTGNYLREKPVAEPPAWATATVPGGLTVAARDREVVLQRPDGTSRVLGPGRPLAVAFAPDGKRLATAGPGPLLRIWNDQGERVATARTPAAARALVYTPDGARLLVLDAAGGISVCDPQTLAPVANWSVEGPANSIACAPDGRTVAVSFGSWLAEEGWVECWSIADRRKLVSYPAPAPVGATRYTPDGRTLVIGAWNGRVVWRALPGGELCAERQMPKHLVATAAFSPDADTLPLAPPPEPPPPVVPQWVERFGPLPDR